MDSPEFVHIEPLEVEDLHAEILGLTAMIPEGRRTSYGLIAEALGDKIASKSVGLVLARNPRPGRPPNGIPCHRVLRSDGRVGKYAFGEELKAELLRSEGVELEDGKALGDPRKPPYRGILERRKAEQSRVRLSAEETCSREIGEFSGTILGLDAAYLRGRLYDFALAVAALVDVPGGIVREAIFTIAPAVVPYIPTYLAYREMPVFVPLAEYLADEADLIAVNGHGLSHPRAGIASHVGYLMDFPTVGVSRKLLRGHPAIKIGKRYVSPGYRSRVIPAAIEAIEKTDRLTKILAREFSQTGASDARRS